jgi:hypothetical protein
VAEIRPAALLCGQLMPTTAVAASDATRAAASDGTPCKRRAKCLNPKEFAKPPSFAPPDTLTYSSHRPLFPPKPASFAAKIMQN